MDYREEPPRYGGMRGQPFGFHGGTPPMLKKLIIINIVVFILQFILYNFFSFEVNEWVSRFFGLYTPWAVGRLHIWQFITYAFLHGDVHHILFNMLFLWMFGRELELVLGSRRFLVFYLTSAIFAGLLYLGFDFAHVSISEDPDVFYKPVIGASGAVMAATMLFGLYWPNRIVLFMLIFPMRVRTFVMIVIAIELFGVLNIESNIAHSAHLGGLLWGYLFWRFGAQVEAWLASRHAAGPTSGPRPSRHEDVFREAQEDSIEDSRRLDAILDKIHREGLQSLTWGERRFLKKMSRKR